MVEDIVVNQMNTTSDKILNPIQRAQRKYHRKYYANNKEDIARKAQERHLAIKDTEEYKKIKQIYNARYVAKQRGTATKESSSCSSKDEPDTHNDGEVNLGRNRERPRTIDVNTLDANLRTHATQEPKIPEHVIMKLKKDIMKQIAEQLSIFATG